MKTEKRSSRATQLFEAKFDPRIKTYFYWGGTLILLLTIVGIVLIPFWLIFGRSYCNKYYDTLFCELTTRALHFKKGIYFRTERTVPLDKIQDLTFKEGPILRYFGLSSLYIETAGQSAQQASDMTLTAIIDAHQFRNMVMEQRDEVTGYRDSTTPAPTSTDQHSLAPLLGEMNETLKRIEKKIGETS